MTIMTAVCGLWHMSFMCKVIKAGGIGRNGSSIAVSQTLFVTADVVFWLLL